MLRIKKNRRFLFANTLRKVADDLEKGEKGSLKRRLNMARINLPECEEDLETLHINLFNKKLKR